MLRIIPLGVVLGLVACGDGDAPAAASAGTDASVAGSDASGSDASGSDASGSDASGSDASGSDAGAFPELGICGQRSEGTVTADSFDAYEEFYLTGEEGFGEELCVVRFDVTRVGAAPSGCDAFAGQQQECRWTHLVQYANPSVVTDRDGACADSELALTAPAIAEIDARRVAYGYVFEYQGHNSVLMQYDEESDVWEAVVNAGWDEASGAFRFDRRNGFCGY